jgi:hypothetical protein
MHNVRPGIGRTLPHNEEIQPHRCGKLANP